MVMVMWGRLAACAPMASALLRRAAQQSRENFSAPSQPHQSCAFSQVVWKREDPGTPSRKHLFEHCAVRCLGPAGTILLSADHSNALCVHFRAPDQCML